MRKFREYDSSSGGKRVPAVGSIILLGGGIVMIMALIGLVISFTGVIEVTYLELALETPGFDYRIENGQEQGNETFEAYQLMRYVSMFLLALVLIVAAVSKVLESSETGIMQPGTANRMISKSLLFILVIAIFPPMWDGAAGAVENVSLWIMNPLYSFDPDSPCPAGWSDADIQDAYDNSAYKKGGLGGQPPSDVCTPKFKATYVFGQMLRNTEIAEIKDGLGIVDPTTPVNQFIGNGTSVISTPIGGSSITSSITNGTGFGQQQQQVSIHDNFLGGLVEGVTKGTEGMFTNIFLGLTKALVAIQILIMSVMMGILADMLTGMVIAGLPVFLMLSLIPKADVIANRMIDCIPALLLLPLMSALILVVGAGSLAEASANAVSVDGWGHVYVWITSIGVVFFAITLPVIMVPMLGSVSQMANQTVSSAIQTGTMVTAMTTTSAAASAVSARRHGAGVLGMMSAGATGLFKGGIASHGNIPTPTFGGGDFMPHPDRALQQGMMAGDMGMPMGQQRQAADAAISKVMEKSQTAAHGNELHKQFPDVPAWDNSLTPDENREAINAKLGRQKPETLTPAQQAAYEEWKGPVGMLAEKGDKMNKADLDTAVEQIQINSKDELRGVSDKVLNDRYIHHAATEAGMSDRAMKKSIDTNTTNMIANTPPSGNMPSGSGSASPADDSSSSASSSASTSSPSSPSSSENTAVQSGDGSSSAPSSSAKSSEQAPQQQQQQPPPQQSPKDNAVEKPTSSSEQAQSTKAAPDPGKTESSSAQPQPQQQPPPQSPKDNAVEKPEPSPDDSQDDGSSSNDDDGNNDDDSTAEKNKKKQDS